MEQFVMSPQSGGL